MKVLPSVLLCAFSGGLGDSAPYFYVFIALIGAINIWFVGKLLSTRDS